MTFEKIKPTLVLTIVSTLVAALLIVSYTLTYDPDAANKINDKLSSALVSAMGGSAEDYSIVSDWKSEGLAIDKPEDVEKLLKKADGGYALELVGKGYSKDSLDILVALNDDGSVKAVKVITTEDTPGLGTKVANEDFLSQYVNLNGKIETVKTAPLDGQIQAITSATYSSKGVTNIVNRAIEVYAQMTGKEAAE